METSLNVYDYPSPPEADERTVTGHVNVSFDVISDVPANWDEEQLREFIEVCVNTHMKYFDNVKIEDIEL